MGWSIGYDSTWKRDVGYAVPATCDHPGCGAAIDRGLGYVCGDAPYGGDHGCGLYFCTLHATGAHQLCERCAKRSRKGPFTPTPDIPEWIAWKLADESWDAWRRDNPEQVTALTAQLAAVVDIP